MRVALFTDTYLPDINGVVTSIELLRKELEKNGHEAYVVCTYPGAIKIKQEGRIIRLPGIELKQLYGYAMASPIHLLFKDDLRKLNFDLIHVHTEFGVGIFAEIVAKQLHIPLVRTYHTTYEDYTHYINFVHLDSVDKLAKKAVSAISKLYGDSCMELIAPSKKTRDMLLKYGIKTPISIIPTGIELSHFNRDNTPKEKISEIRQSLNIQDDEKLLLYVGRIAQEKSLDMIIRTFLTIKQEGLKIKLLIVGGGPQLEELQKLTTDLNLNDYISFAGKIPFGDIPSYYHSADAFISASTSETQGMTYIEALSSGLIVFARYDEVLEDLVFDQRNGFLFNDEQELVAKIKQYLALDVDTIQKMKDEAISSTKMYNADIFGDSVIKLYEKAILEYAQNYNIISVRLKDDYVVVKIKSNDMQEETVYVTLDRYSDMGLRKDGILSFKQYDEIKKSEQAVLAYRACLKKLANKDYTIKEMYDYLNNNFDIQIKEVNEIIDKLIDLKLLDDYRYALEKIESYEKALISEKHIIYNLKKAGVPLNIIEELVIEKIDEASDLAKAKKLAEKYQSQIHNKSMKMKKQLILQKLLKNGFNYDDANKVVGLLSFQDETFEEKNLLRKEALKAKRHFERKYSGSNLRNRIYHSLVSKGFETDAVYAILNEMEWNDD